MNIMMDTTETIPPTTEKQKPDMTKVREAKKRKQEVRDTTLTDMKNQISSLASLMKSDMKSDIQPGVKSDVKTDTNKKYDSDDDDDQPVVVTRKKHKQNEDDKPSLTTEIFRTAIVGLLGLGTWYANSIWRQPVKTLPEPKIEPKIVPKIEPKIEPKRFIEPVQALKRKVGASGLLE